MKANLFINYYIDNHPKRHREIVACLLSNIRNKHIDRLILVVGKEHLSNLSIVLKRNNLEEYEKQKVIISAGESRPSYNEYFRMSNEYPDDINIIANTDMVIGDDTAKRIKLFKWDNYCMALSRWDYIDDGMRQDFARLHDRRDSQDVWIVKGRFKDIPEADFCLGKKGCDNKIAHLLSKYYNVINPSKSLRTFHYHLTNIRNYAPHGTTEDLILPPYKMLPTQKLPI